jgi:hypothetical protein
MRNSSPSISFGDRCLCRFASGTEKNWRRNQAIRAVVNVRYRTSLMYINVTLLYQLQIHQVRVCLHTKSGDGKGRQYEHSTLAEQSGPAFDQNI